MLFRIEGRLFDLDVVQADAMQMRFAGEHDVTVRLEERSLYDDEFSESIYYLNMTAQGNWLPSKRVQDLFEHLAHDELPSKLAVPRFWVHAERDEFGRIVRSTGNRQIGYVPALDDLPDEVEELVKSAEEELSEKFRYAVNLFRWRFGLRGPHDPIHDKLFDWSLDDGNWKTVPFRASQVLEVL